MNSEEGCTVLKARSRLGVPRSVLIPAIVLDILLISIGLLMIFPIEHSFKAFGMQINLSMASRSDLFNPLTFSFIPAAIYAVGILRYGRFLFGEAASVERARAWWRLVLLSAALYFATILYSLFQARREALWWVVAVAVLAWGAPLFLWTWVGRWALLRAEHERAAGWINKALLLAGSAMIMSSLALDIDYASPGWSILIWMGSWPTLQFAAIEATVPWLKAVCLAGYAAGLLLAGLSVWTIVRLVVNKPPGQRFVVRLRSLSVVVFWFAVTNYLFSSLLDQYVGIFLGRLYGLNAVEFVVITSAWLLVLAAGILLWFKYSTRTDEQGRRVITALLLWALPLVPLTVYRLPDALGWGLYGIVFFVFGASVVATCWWKLAEVKSAVAVASPEAKTSSQAGENLAAPA